MEKIKVIFSAGESRKHRGCCDYMQAYLYDELAEKYGIEELYAEYYTDLAYKVDRFGLDSENVERGSYPIDGEEVGEEDDEVVYITEDVCGDKIRLAEADDDDCGYYYHKLYPRDDIYVDEDGKPLMGYYSDPDPDELFIVQKGGSYYYITRDSRKLSDKEADERIFETLKAEIIEQAKKHGIPENMLKFD